ncbi:MAG: L,D-transpeptidase [Chloroflexi bacterium]|nr:L,D-transpeptidase [Chloroflexota bacterium]
MPPLSATPVASLPIGPEDTLAGLATTGEGNKEKRIEIDLSAQTLVAYEGDVPIFIALVSTGTAWTPTPVGQFRIYRKLLKQDMSGPGYYLADVPYVQYFFGAYALHGAYWHNDFGRPVSHGCVNLTVEDARWLFNWTEPTLAPGEFEVQSTVSIPGTLVVVRE